MGGYDYDGHYIAHWNEADPISDTNFPNIEPFNWIEDWFELYKDNNCMTETMDEVNPDGQTFPV